MVEYSLLSSPLFFTIIIHHLLSCFLLPLINNVFAIYTVSDKLTLSPSYKTLVGARSPLIRLQIFKVWEALARIIVKVSTEPAFGAEAGTLDRH